MLPLIIISFTVSAEKKKKNILKVEHYVLFGDFLRTSSRGSSLSNRFEELLQRGKDRATTHRNFCDKDQVLRTKVYC